MSLMVDIHQPRGRMWGGRHIKEIGKICRENGTFFHSDAAQAVGKVPIDVNDMNIDLMSISGHKLYGPKGIGALYIRRKPRVRITPLINGGGQERGFRSGTLPTPVWKYIKYYLINIILDFFIFFIFSISFVWG